MGEAGSKQVFGAYSLKSKASMMMMISGAEQIPDGLHFNRCLQEMQSMMGFTLPAWQLVDHGLKETCTLSQEPRHPGYDLRYSVSQTKRSNRERPEHQQ